MSAEPCLSSKAEDEKHDLSVIGFDHGYVIWRCKHCGLCKKESAKYIRYTEDAW